MIKLIIIIAILAIGGYFLLGNNAANLLEDNDLDSSGQVVPDSVGVEDIEVIEETDIEEEQVEEIVEVTGSVVKEFNIKAFRWGYDPEVITVKKGDKVKLIIDNSDFEHGLRIPKLGVSGKEIIEFTADEIGEFDWFCTNFCGSGHSDMSGKFIVEE